MFIDDKMINRIEVVGGQSQDISWLVSFFTIVYCIMSVISASFHFLLTLGPFALFYSIFSDFFSLTSTNSQLIPF